LKGKGVKDLLLISFVLVLQLTTHLPQAIKHARHGQPDLYLSHYGMSLKG
jgi:hypothetical protein